MHAISYRVLAAVLPAETVSSIPSKMKTERGAVGVRELLLRILGDSGWLVHHGKNSNRATLGRPRLETSVIPPSLGETLVWGLPWTGWMSSNRLSRRPISPVLNPNS